MIDVVLMQFFCVVAMSILAANLILNYYVYRSDKVCPVSETGATIPTVPDKKAESRFEQLKNFL